MGFVDGVIALCLGEMKVAITLCSHVKAIFPIFVIRPTSAASSGGAMGELDSKTWFDEAQTYQRVRRLALLFNVAYIASFVGFVICVFSALAHNWDALAAVLFLLYFQEEHKVPASPAG